MESNAYAERLRAILRHLEDKESPDWKALVGLCRDAERIRHAAGIRDDIKTPAFEIRVHRTADDLNKFRDELIRRLSTHDVGTLEHVVAIHYTDPDLCELRVRPLQWTRTDGITKNVGKGRALLTATEMVRGWIRMAETANETEFDVTKEMLRQHTGKSTLTNINAAFQGREFAYAKRGKIHWYSYAEVLPILKAHARTRNENWPPTVHGLQKQQETGKKQEKD